MYTAWIKVDETLPWIELKGKYQTKKDARKAVNNFLSNVEVKIVTIPERKTPIKALATVKATR